LRRPDALKEVVNLDLKARSSAIASELASRLEVLLRAIAPDVALTLTITLDTRDPALAMHAIAVLLFALKLTRNAIVLGKRVVADQAASSLL
jgi:hypothetical protein